MLSKSNIRGLAFLLPVLLLVLLVILLVKPRSEDLHSEDTQLVTNSTIVEKTLFEFDPNTADYDQLRRLGLSQASAAAVIRRQRSGWIFAVEEELAAIYGVDDSLYYRLKPYIVIADEFKAKPRPREEYKPRRHAAAGRNKIEYRPFRMDTVSVRFLTTVGFSERQAAVIINYRDMRGGLYSIDEFAQCYVVDDDICDTLAYYIIFPEREKPAIKGLIEINSADSAMLRSVFGIGEKSVTDILEYRERLGGFYDLRQLAEVKSVTENNFEKILTQIYCDSCKISKIDINFATQAQLERHPYIAPRKLRKLLSKRQLKGGWSKIEEMVDDDIFTEQEAERVRPYLRFAREAE